MEQQEARLEQELLSLGRQELALETEMALLKTRAKEAGLAGRLRESDLAWELFEVTRESLSRLQVDIGRVERKLYGFRRK